MDQTVRRTRLLGLPGSLRKTSYSRAVLRGLEVELGTAADFEIRDVRLPLYNEDEDGAPRRRSSGSSDRRSIRATGS